MAAFSKAASKAAAKPGLFWLSWAISEAPRSGPVAWLAWALVLVWLGFVAGVAAGAASAAFRAAKKTGLWLRCAKSAGPRSRGGAGFGVEEKQGRFAKTGVSEGGALIRSGVFSLSAAAGGSGLFTAPQRTTARST